MSRPIRILLHFIAALSVVAAALAGPGLAKAQESQAPILAVIDVQKIIRESTAVKSMSKRIEAQRSNYQAELRKKEEVLRKSDRELARQRAVLSAAVYAEKRNELEKQVAAMQREVKQKKRKLDRLFSTGMGKVQNELVKVAKEIAEERGLDMVLSKAAVVIVKPKFDITAEALKRLNEHLPDVVLTQPQE